MNLYEINEVIESLVDRETGEILDYEAFENLTIERNEKAENIALWVKNLTAEAEAIKAEEETLKARRKTAEKNAERLKQYLGVCLDHWKFSSPKVAVTFRTSQVVQITKALPEEYHKNGVLHQENRYYKEITGNIDDVFDKNKIKSALKNGAEIDGATLETRQNIQIK